MSASIYEPPPPPRPRRLGGTYGFLLALLACLVLGTWVATQYVAYHFGAHASLGPVWLLMKPGSVVYLRAAAVLCGGAALAALLLAPSRRFALPLLLVSAVLLALSTCSTLYGPFRYFQWVIAYRGFDAASPYLGTFREGLIAGSLGFSASVLAMLLLRANGRQLRPTGSHGTAAWGDGRELMTGAGLLLGRMPAGKKQTKLLRYDGEGHLITVAPTRSGKGVGSVIPNLLTYPGSVVVTDPKGENYAVTARQRREGLEHRTIALDPFDQLRSFSLPPSTHAFNPMDLISPEGTDILESASLLADMLVVPSARGGEELFWAEEAKALLSGLILYVAAVETDENARPTPRRTLLRVRELLTLPKDAFSDLMHEMQTSTLAGGLAARAAARLLQKEEKERSGVVSTAQSHTHFLDSPRMTHVMERSTFELAALKQERLSIYLILPAHYLDAYSRWLRLMIACALHEIARTPGRPRERVLFLLDEFANLGRMNPVLRAVSLLAGYGAQIWMFLQDLSQLKGTYPDQWGTFLANADVLQAFGTNDYDTSQHLSNLTGDMTIYVETENQSLSHSRGRHLSHSRSSSQSYAEKARRLLLPDEVRRMPPEEQLLFVKGIFPLRALKLNYLWDPEFISHGAPVFEENPMHATARQYREEQPG